MDSLDELRIIFYAPPNAEEMYRAVIRERKTVAPYHYRVVMTTDETVNSLYPLLFQEDEQDQFRQESAAAFSNGLVINSLNLRDNKKIDNILTATQVISTFTTRSDYNPDSTFHIFLFENTVVAPNAILNRTEVVTAVRQGKVTHVRDALASADTASIDERLTRIEQQIRMKQYFIAAKNLRLLHGQVIRKPSDFQAQSILTLATLLANTAHNLLTTALEEKLEKTESDSPKEGAVFITKTGSHQFISTGCQQHIESAIESIKSAVTLYLLLESKTQFNLLLCTCYTSLGKALQLKMTLGLSEVSGSTYQAAKKAFARALEHASEEQLKKVIEEYTSLVHYTNNLDEQRSIIFKCNELCIRHHLGRAILTPAEKHHNVCYYAEELEKACRVFQLFCAKEKNNTDDLKPMLTSLLYYAEELYDLARYYHHNDLEHQTTTTLTALYNTLCLQGQVSIKLRRCGEAINTFNRALQYLEKHLIEQFSEHDLNENVAQINFQLAIAYDHLDKQHPSKSHLVSAITAWEEMGVTEKPQECVRLMEKHQLLSGDAFKFN